MFYLDKIDVSSNDLLEDHSSLKEGLPAFNFMFAEKTLRDSGSYNYKHNYLVNTFKFYNPETQEIVLDCDYLISQYFKKNKSLKIGDEINSMSFILWGEDLDLKRKNKNNLKLDGSIFYRPLGKRKTIGYMSGTRSGGSRAIKKLIADLYLPITSFEVIEHSPRRIYKTESQIVYIPYEIKYLSHSFFYRKFIEEIEYSKNKKYLLDKLNLITEPSNRYGEVEESYKLTNKIIKRDINHIKNFIKKWDNFQVEKFS